MCSGLAQYAYFSQAVELGQAAEYGLHGTLSQVFHSFAPFAVLSGVGPHVRFVVYRSGDTFAFLFWRTLGFHGAGLAVPRCRPIVFQYATVLVGAEPFEGQGSVHRATVLVLFLVVWKTVYLGFVFTEDGNPPGDLPLFQKIVVGAVGIPCVRKEVRHLKLVLPWTALGFQADILQVLAVPSVGKVRLDMRDDTFSGIHRHAAMVVELSGLAGLERYTGIRIAGTVVRLVA